MNDVETLLTDHLQTKAAALTPANRLARVRAEVATPRTPWRPRGRVRAFVVRPVWLGAAAGVVATAGVASFAAVQWSESEPPSPTVAPGALPVTPGPTINDHWHTAYAFWLCGEWVTLQGALEEPGAVGNQEYLASGIHSHDDGVIHIHPFTSAGSGPNATLGTFLAGYGVELGDDSLRFPPAQGPGDVPMRCGAEPARLTVTLWPDADDPDESVVYTDRLADVPLGDGAAMTIAVTSDGSVPLPPAAPNVAELGAVDGGGPVDTAP
jgi:hypothetical protein